MQPTEDDGERKKNESNILNRIDGADCWSQCSKRKRKEGPDKWLSVPVIICFNLFDPFRVVIYPVEVSLGNV